MRMSFELHPNLQGKSTVIDLPLCQVLLEDNAYYPWLLLVPRKENLLRLIDLETSDRLQISKELDLAQRILWKMFQPSQLNVAAIGNKTPQLHIHIIARFTEDPAWPETAWDHSAKELYAPEQKNKLLEALEKDFRDALPTL